MKQTSATNIDINVIVVAASIDSSKISLVFLQRRLRLFRSVKFLFWQSIFWPVCSKHHRVFKFNCNRFQLVRNQISGYDFSPFQSRGFCVHLLSIYEIVSMSVLGTSQQIIRSNSFWSIWFGDRLLNGISTSTERTIRRETARAKLNDKRHKTIHTFWMTWINSVPYH